MRPLKQQTYQQRNPHRVRCCLLQQHHGIYLPRKPCKKSCLLNQQTVPPSTGHKWILPLGWQCLSDKLRTSLDLCCLLVRTCRHHKDHRMAGQLELGRNQASTRCNSLLMCLRKNLQDTGYTWSHWLVNTILPNTSRTRHEQCPKQTYLRYKWNTLSNLRRYQMNQKRMRCTLWFQLKRCNVPQDRAHTPSVSCRLRTVQPHKTYMRLIPAVLHTSLPNKDCMARFR